MVLKRVDTAKYPKALCLDGSAGAFYITAATSPASTDKWFVSHNGGGWCSLDVPFAQSTTADHCYNRSFGRLGSTAAYPPTTGLPSDYYSADPALNPMMHDWNKVQLVYCDGGSFSGQREDAVEVLGQALHFRGAYILEAIISTLLEDHGLKAASDVVVSGQSAGGLATYLHADRWREAIPKSAFVAAMPDGGFFLDWDATVPASAAHSYAHELRRNFADFNASGGLDQSCVAAHLSAGGDAANCYFAEHTIPFVEMPLFALQSVVDSWQLGNILGSSTDVAKVNIFRNVATQRILEAHMRSPQHGGFIDSCVHHCFLWDELHIKGVRMADAFTAWYGNQRKAWALGVVFGPSEVWWQAQAFPCTACCKGSLARGSEAEGFFVREAVTSYV